jgi:hypothetical protein
MLTGYDYALSTVSTPESIILLDAIEKLSAEPEERQTQADSPNEVRFASLRADS